MPKASRTSKATGSGKSGKIKAAEAKARRAKEFVPKRSGYSR